jgi:glutamyl-queuosine tRNA(Asp) synthetase
VAATGRFAPSPTGVLHLGNLRTALASWLSVKSRGGRWIVRVEDVDAARCRTEWADAQLRDLETIGLVSDVPVVRQSERSDLYRAALGQLAARGHLYRCVCSRKDLQVLASAPHGDEGLRPYPGLCRANKVDHFVADALRAEMPPGLVEWKDLLLGAQADDPAAATGDPVLHRRDGCFAYHLAVVVDDAEQGVTEVVRGADLRDVTATQIRLQELLGLARPAYAHPGLLTATDGARLGKRAGATSLNALRQRGISILEVIGWLGWSLGCLPQPDACRPDELDELIKRFDWARVPVGPVPVPESWA